MQVRVSDVAEADAACEARDCPKSAKGRKFENREVAVVAPVIKVWPATVVQPLQTVSGINCWNPPDAIEVWEVQEAVEAERVLIVRRRFWENPQTCASP